MFNRLALAAPELYKWILLCWKKDIEEAVKEDPSIKKSPLYMRSRKRLLKKITSFNPRWGSHIQDAVSEMVEVSQYFDVPVIADFNDISIIAKPGDTEKDLLEYYQKCSAERSKKYERSFKAALARRSAESRREEENRRRVIIEDWLSKEKLQIKKGLEKEFETLREINSDAYGKGIIDFATAWGVSMQRSMREGNKISEMAGALSQFADVWGMSGFSYSMAVKVLVQFWRCGNALRKWHNLEYQIGNEGEKANQEGGVLNIAILNIS